MEFTVSLVSTTIEESFSTEKISVSQEDLKNTTKFGRKIFISHEELFSKPSYYFPDDHLHFKVKIFVKHDFSVFVDESNIILGHYGDLFNTMKRSDFTIGTSDGEKLEAHKAILAARSEVFDAMLTIDMEEKRENFVAIEDFDSNVLRELLRFIYCEHVANIEKLDIDLYKVAEKYAIERLPELCLDSIYNRIDETNVVEIAAFAEVYNGRKPLNDLFMSCVLIIEA
jgi:speckle-type POZ protein